MKRVKIIGILVLALSVGIVVLQNIESVQTTIEAPCSKLQGMFCLSAVLRATVRNFN